MLTDDLYSHLWTNHAVNQNFRNRIFPSTLEFITGTCGSWGTHTGQSGNAGCSHVVAALPALFDHAIHSFILLQAGSGETKSQYLYLYLYKYKHVL
jgi:hypothetical protein